MATVDQANNMLVVQAFEPGEISATSSSIVVDTSGFEAVTFVLTLGDYTDGNFAFYFEDSDDGITYTPVYVDTAIVEGAQIIPLNPVIAPAVQTLFPYSTSPTDYTITAANASDWTFDGMDGTSQSWWVGYVGPKRYLSFQINVAGMPGTGMSISADWILEWPHTAPTRLIAPNQVG